MLAPRLIRAIEDHAEALTKGVIHDLQRNPRTPSYNRVPAEELHRRVYDVYRHLGKWLDRKADDAIETSYAELGRRRSAEGVPLSEVVQALILVKHHLRDYIRSAGLVDSAVELYQEDELQRFIGQFFDKALYFTVKGYEAARKS
jgi:hypothetical protein